MLTQARHWLEARDVESKAELDCPVCERPIQSTELKAVVSAALEVLTAENGRVAELGEAHTEATSAVEDLERIIEVVARQREKVNKLRAGELRLATGIVVEIRKMAAGGLSEGDEIAAPVATSLSVLNKLVGDVAAEDLDAFPSDDVNAALGRLQGLVATAQQRTAKEVAEAGSSARALRERVVALEKAVAFLEADLSLNALDGVVAGTELNEALASLGAVDAQLDTLEAVLRTAEQVSESEAKARIDVIAPLLGEWFGRLSRHDSLRSAEIAVTTSRAGGSSKNSYTICATSDDGWRTSSAPTLSGGYQSVLAVAALCTLSEDEGSHTRLGLLALDEPALSLDARLSTRMAAAMGAHAAASRLLLTTTDDAFAEALTTGAGASKVRVIRLNEWTATKGTHVAAAT